ncbi:helix-turn-helix transcriptional regulator [Collinsella sp. An2]|uniref:helix-turn-helix transcriptional regulator n=1 Tax=Collinsella sp. An2 TaxID=1965585 RepID=UPI00130272C4|nr:helix-turn-helix transcriptional regulator [Collinsella sp. An2]
MANDGASTNRTGDAAAQRDATAMPAFSVDTYKVLAPPIAGIASSTMVANLIIQEAHRTTGVSTAGGLTMVAACAVLAVLFISTLVVKRYTKRAVSLMTFLSVHISGLSALALTFLDVAGSAPDVLRTALECAATAASALLSFYWMRKLRGTSAQAVVVVAFCALALSEFGTFVASFSGNLVAHAIAFVLAFAQFLYVRVSRAMDVPSDQFPAVSESYFGTDRDRFSNRSFLAVAAVGFWFISIPMGMGRGFPAGDAIFMSPVPRFLALVFVCVVSAVWVRHGMASRMRALTTSIWVVMELLLALGAIFFAIWPRSIGVGASFIMASALVLQAFIWYLTMAFISFGWRDAYYYASAAWISMNVLTVAGMEVDRLLARVFFDNTPVIISIMSLFVLVSAQVVYTKLLSAPSQQSEASSQEDAATSEHDGRGHITQDDVRRIPLMGVMALRPQAELPLPSVNPDARIATSVIELGQRFGLTGREIEVLTLYALGHTQARVSEELQLSQNTVHTHIKRIYEKTDLHSRQEILDYINEYGSAAAPRG